MKNQFVFPPQEMSPGEMTLEGLLDMSEEQVCELLQKFGASEEECARLNASLSCLRKAHQLGKDETATGTSTEATQGKKRFSQSYITVALIALFKM